MSRATASSARTRTILIVDDMPANLTVLVDHLERVGHRVLIAEDSDEALERASLKRPDLILLDVVMLGDVKVRQGIHRVVDGLQE